MHFLVVMDPIDGVDVDKDTTFGFLLAAQARGHECWVCHARDLYCVPDGAAALCRKVEVWHRREYFFRLDPPESRALASFDSVWMRSDPPVDWTYLHATYLLDIAGCLVVNSPAALRDANEKLYTLRFPELCPQTMVTNDAARIRGWLDGRSEPLIVKPVDGHGGKGVFVLRRGDPNVAAILETLTDEGRRWIMAQEYLPAAKEGDKRVILVDGEPLGAILRVPQGDDHRGNIHVGGRVAATEVTPRDREICAALAPSLRANGLWFVGIDVIGGLLTEVNVTSPTGIREVKALGGPDLGDLYVAWVEGAVSDARRGAPTASST